MFPPDTADEDVQHVVGEEKKTGDIQSLDNSNVEVDIARNHLDEIEERNAVTIDLLKDVDVAFGTLLKHVQVFLDLLYIQFGRDFTKM